MMRNFAGKNFLVLTDSQNIAKLHEMIFYCHTLWDLAILNVLVSLIKNCSRTSNITYQSGNVSIHSITSQMSVKDVKYEDKQTCYKD